MEQGYFDFFSLRSNYPTSRISKIQGLPGSVFLTIPYEFYRQLTESDTYTNTGIQRLIEEINNSYVLRPKKKQFLVLNSFEELIIT